MKRPFVCLVTGASGAGKTTVSMLLAKKYKKCAVIESDNLRGLVKSGKADTFTKDGHEQLVLSTKNSCALAKNFVDAGFNVIIDDYIGGEGRSSIYKKNFKSKYNFVSFVLIPNKEITIKRDAKRTGSAKMGVKRIIYLHDLITKRSLAEKDWILIDNTKHHPQKTAIEMFKYINRLFAKK